MSSIFFQSHHIKVNYTFSPFSQCPKQLTYFFPPKDYVSTLSKTKISSFTQFFQVKDNPPLNLSLIYSYTALYYH